MRVQFRYGVAGANFSYRPKVVYDLPEHVAREFLKSGSAFPVDPPEPTPALLQAPARATRRRGGKRAEIATERQPELRG